MLTVHTLGAPMPGNFGAKNDITADEIDTIRSTVNNCLVEVARQPLSAGACTRLIRASLEPFTDEFKNIADQDGAQILDLMLTILLSWRGRLAALNKSVSSGEVALELEAISQAMIATPIVGDATKTVSGFVDVLRQEAPRTNPEVKARLLKAISKLLMNPNLPTSKAAAVEALTMLDVYLDDPDPTISKLAGDLRPPLARALNATVTPAQPPPKDKKKSGSDTGDTLTTALKVGAVALGLGAIGWLITRRGKSSIGPDMTPPEEAMLAPMPPEPLPRSSARKMSSQRRSSARMSKQSSAATMGRAGRYPILY